MKCVVVDDNPSDRDLLCSMINRTPGMSLITSFDLGLTALEFLQHNKHVDIIFLDIEMPDISGLYFLDLLPEGHPHLIVFTSGHTSSAILGINQYTQVIGFLEKIYSYQEFFQVVQKARRLLLQKNNLKRFLDKHMVDSDLVFIKTSFNRKERYERINLNELLFIKSDRNYVHLVTSNKEYLVKRSMSEMEQQLSKKNFIRVHKSFLINLQSIRGVEVKQLFMDDGKSVPISETYRSILLQKLGEMSIEDK